MKFVFFVFAIIGLFSCSTVKSGEAANMENIKTAENVIVENTIKISGRVQVYGNEPRTFVGILDMDGVEYAVYPRSKEDELRPLQGHLTEFTVVFIDEQTFGSLFLRGGTVTPIKWEIIQ